MPGIERKPKNSYMGDQPALASVKHLGISSNPAQLKQADRKPARLGRLTAGDQSDE